jgi:Vitamin B12 dependent methionine synthase, activation domain.
MKHFIDKLDYVPNKAALLKAVRLDPDSDEADDFTDIVDCVAVLAKPKAYVASATVGDSSVYPAIRIDGVEFSGSILYDNVKDLETVWPFIATCGMEAYQYVMSIPDPIEKIWGEIVLENILGIAEKAMSDFIAGEVYDGKTASIAPGSLSEWPVEQQVPLFTILGEGPGKCGITLTETMLMIPNKSISGIVFPNEHGYVSCKLCPREGCPNRRAAYESENLLSTF